MDHPAAWIVTTILIVVAATSFVIGEAGSRAERRQREVDALVVAFIKGHGCTRDHYVSRHGVIFKCDNGMFSERDIEREVLK